MKVKILTIGDELLIGQVVDSNSAWLGSQLEALSIKVLENRSIPDDEATIITTLDEMLSSSDAVLITGGLGPTKDDVTKKAIAKFLGVELVWKEEIFEWLKQLFQKYKIEPKETHKSQAYVPEGCTVIANKMGTAQGMWMEKNGKIILSMPGVPYEMQYIMKHGGFEKLISKNGGEKIYHKTIMTAGWGETMIEEAILDIVDQLEPTMKVAYLPGLGKVRVRVSCLSKNGIEAVEEVSLQIADRLRSITYGFDDLSLEEAVGNLLKEKAMTMATAESCTGGNVASSITSIAGSSVYFKGSIVAYANEVKVNQLNVKEVTLKKFGAVSEETVTEMVNGAIRNLHVDVAIATSGIAGPGGGTPEKPVGTIWIAVGNCDRVKTRKLQLTKNRLTNIEYTSIAALNMLRKFLLGE